MSKEQTLNFIDTHSSYFKKPMQWFDNNWHVVEAFENLFPEHLIFLFDKEMYNEVGEMVMQKQTEIKFTDCLHKKNMFINISFQQRTLGN